jgi:hypothetical protein
MVKFSLGAFLTLLLLGFQPCSAQFISNGSFETPVVSTGAPDFVPPTDWTFSSSTEDLIVTNSDGVATTPYGNQFVFLDENGSSVAQVISDFVAGQSYTLSVDFQSTSPAVLSGPAPLPASMELALSGTLFNGATLEEIFTSTGPFTQLGGQISFDLASLTFTPFTSGSGTFQIIDTTNAGATGVFVDNVTLTKNTSTSPEPSVLALMLAGFGLLGFCARRKLA